VKKSTILGITTLMVVAWAPSRLAAQVSVEGRVGGAWPMGELSDDPGLNQSFGISLALDVMYAVAPNVSLYGGGSRQSFNCDDCPADVTTSGVVAGVKYRFPGSGMNTWLRGGVMLHRASVDGASQDWGFGVDSGVGVDIAVRPSMSIVPAVRLNSYGSGPLSLTYVTLDLGINFVPALE
jgi:opacity protein-like surface antigen